MNNHISISKKIPVPVLVFSLLYLLIIILSLKIPMFWDMSYISRIGNLIYDNHFSSIIFNEWDNGTPPLYSIYLAILWAVLGKSLFICHVAVLPFAIGIVYFIYKISVRFIDTNYISLVLLLVFIEPTMLTQTILSGYDIALCFLFLAGLDGVMENKRIRLALYLLFIPVLNLRGFTLVFSIFLMDVYINRAAYKNVKTILINVSAFIPATLLFSIWLSYHYYQTGWLYFSERGSQVFIKTISFESILRNVAYIIWKMIDFGRIGLFVFILWLFIRFRKVKPFNMFFFFLFATVISYVIFFLPFSIPVSHRYFMIAYIIGILTFVYFVSTLKQKYLKVLSSTIVAVMLLSGNIWLYPERFGNGWDSSLKVLPYFSLKKQLDNYLVSSNIDPKSVGTKFPIDFDNYDCNLNNEHFAFVDLDKKQYQEIPYVVQSNISNTFTAEEINTFNTKWTLVKELRSWPVYIKLFKNPEK